MSRGTGNELDSHPFVRLAQARLAPRVRGLLEGVYQALQPVIDTALARALDDLDRDLLAHSNRGSNPAVQAQCLASLREFRQQRGDFLAACRAGVQRSLLSLVDATVHDESLQPVSAREDWGRLDAATAAAREEDLTLSQIATRAEIRAAADLQALAYRFAVIAGSPPIDIAQLALGPCRLCAALRTAARRFAVIPAHRMALYRRVEKTLFVDSGGLYAAVNGYLIGHRVFAHLRLAQAPDDAPERLPAAPVAAPAVVVPDPPASARAVAAAATPADASATPALRTPSVPTPAANIAARTETKSTSGDLRQPRASPSAPLDADFFRLLGEQVSAGRPGARESGMRPEAGQRTAGSADLQQALSALQAKPLAPIMVDGRWADRTVAHLKQDLVNLLRNSGDGGPSKLRDEDAAAIDLVGLLFDQLLAAYRPNSLCHALVSRLQIPLLKAVLADPGFFTRRAHPARRFLNAVVECIADWVEDEDSDRSVIEKLQMIVDRLTREFADDLACFDRCLDELEKHLGSLQRKADVAERRHVEAARGREKLDLARAAAQEAVQQRLRNRSAPQAVASLLESAWADAIALALLRQGLDHPKTHARIALVEQLLALFDAAHTPESRHAALDRLRGDLEDGLAAVGFHDDAISLAWNDLIDLVDARNESQRSEASRAIAELIRQKPRLGGDAPGGAAEVIPALAGDAAAGSDPPLREMTDYIGQLPFGTWFEFVAGRNGDVSRRRLSWLSQVTGRCLFVNPRGARCDDRSIGQLAREMLDGIARVAPADRDQPIDRAWRSIASALRDARPLNH